MNCFPFATTRLGKTCGLICAIIFLLAVDLNGQEDSASVPSQTGKTTFAAGYLKAKVSNYYLQKHKQPLFLLPFASWNNYDKWSVGAGVFTNPAKETKFSFRLFPGWSFTTERLNYTGHISYKLFSEAKTLSVVPYVWAQSYTYQQNAGMFPSFLSVHGGIDFIPETKKTFSGFNITWHYVDREYLEWNLLESMYVLKNISNSVVEASAATQIFGSGKQNLQKFAVEFNRDICKTSMTSVHVFNYGDASKSFSIRFLGGMFLSRKIPFQHDYRFRLSGISGKHDYTFSHVYLSRSESGKEIQYNQIFPENGFFKTLVPLGQTWKWMAAVNLKTDLPGIIPLQIYLDLGTYEGAGTLYPESKYIPWNFGLIIPVVREKAEIFIPLFMSNDIKHYYDINQISFFNRITWMIRFDEINPFKTLKQ
jgi:hypothetical protein